MRAIFLDRDGVICKNHSDYIKSWDEFEFLPGAIEGLIALSKLNLPIIVITNQSAIGRGIVSAQVVNNINQQMVDQVTTEGGRIDRVFMCPHQPEDKCECRKPRSGMFLQASTEMGIDLVQSYMVGDAATDIVAGQQVGCLTFLVLTGRGTHQLVPAFRSVSKPFSITRNLKSAASEILKTEWYINSTAGMRHPYANQYNIPIMDNNLNTPVLTQKP